MIFWSIKLYRNGLVWKSLSFILHEKKTKKAVWSLLSENYMMHEKRFLGKVHLAQFFFPAKFYFADCSSGVGNAICKRHQHHD